jgi:predicted permease
MIDAIGQDLRYAVRRLTKSPGFTLVAVLSLGLGIGANTAIFSIVNSLLLKGPPVQSPEQLVEVYTSEDGGGYPYSVSSYPDFIDLRDNNEVFSEVLTYNLTFALVEPEDGGQPAMLNGELVSGNYFGMLGVPMAAGRTFLPEEDETTGTHPVVILGYDFWQREYGGSGSAIGAELRIFRRPYTVIGVAAEGFKGMMPGLIPDLYMPVRMWNELNPGGGDRLARRGSRSLFVKGRLEPGVTLEQAQASVSAFSEALAAEYPESNEGRKMSLLASQDVAFHPMVDRALVPVAALLFTVVGIVLLIACANLASFLLARAQDRQKEIAVRLALGARRVALIRQLLIETVLLASFGGAAGVLLAHWTIRALLSFQPPIPIPLNLDIGIDNQVLLFTVVVSLVAGVLFGLVPALQSTRPQIASTLRDESGGAIGTRRRMNVRSFLVVAQVSLSLVLLIGAGLFVRSLQKAQAIEPGFYDGPAAMVWPNLDMSLIGAEEGPALQEAITRRLESITGVTHVTAAGRLPLGMNVQTTGVLPAGAEPPEGLDRFDVDNVTVGDRYFETMEVPVVRGRAFNEGDVPGGNPVVVVSEAFVRRFWPNTDPIGQTVESRGAEHVVVGVARDTKVRTLGEAPRPYIYFSARQRYNPAIMYVLRGNVAPSTMVAQSRAALRELRPDLVVLEAKTMDEHLSIMLFAPRMAALLLSVFGGLALALAAIGLYGLISYAVARRTREVGIRISLGAGAGDVVRLVVGGGMRLVVVGSAIGMLLSATVTWLISSFLYGIGTMDVATFVSIPALLIGVALLAASVPARRATRVNPVEALRSE